MFFVLDLTERRRAEEQLQAAQRMDAVGRLAGGMAHEANNQMRCRLGAASFSSLRQVPPSGRGRIGRVDPAAWRSAPRPSRGSCSPSAGASCCSRGRSHLNRLVTKLEPILRRTLTEQQTLRLQLAPNIPPVRADPAQLDQVLLNLTINARDAMPDGGTLTVETRHAPSSTERPGRERPSFRAATPC